MGQVAQCTLKNCAVKCLVDPTSASCQACGRSHCDSLAKSCSGLTTLPPDPTGCNKTSNSNVDLAALALLRSDTDADKAVEDTTSSNPATGGKCTDDDAAKSNSAAFSCSAITCAKKNFFRLDATATCIAGESGITSGCANCFGQVAQCTLKNCAVKCLVDPTSASCQACGHSHCDSLAKSCSGLTTLPPDPTGCNKVSNSNVDLAALALLRSDIDVDNHVR